MNIMKNKIYFLLSLLAFVTSCAKRGSITGGEKDLTAPKLINSYPKNFSTQFKENTIKITFDEYIKVKDLSKNLVVSPLMKQMPIVSPQGGVSKQLTIKIADTLKPNTTYSFNFGQSIIDNNEGNVLKNFKYVFSTGKELDSLTLEGVVKDVYEKETPKFVNVMLYEVDEKYNDSIVYKETPRYITNTSDSTTTFKLENLKAGKYKLVALKENVSNYKFDPKKDKIGFYNQIINIPDKTLYEIELFKEKPIFTSKKPIQAAGNRILLGFEGKANKINIKASQRGVALPIKTTQFKGKDSIQVWFKPIKNDSIELAVQNENYKKIYPVIVKDFKKDTLNISSKISQVHLKENFKIETATPLERWDANKMALTKKGGKNIAFTTRYEEFQQTFEFLFDKEENEKYELKILPETFEDYLGNKNKDTITYSFTTKALADYGNLKLSLKNVKSFPLIVELTDNKGKVMYQQFVTKVPEVSFDLIEPQKYNIRVIYDTNNNQEWDSGSFIENRQPEAVYHFPTEIDVRANWDVNQDIDLGK